MIGLYEVTYVAASNAQELDDGISDTLTVAAKDVEAAIAKVKRREIGRKWSWEDEDGKKRHEKVAAIRIESVKHIRQIDLN